MYWIDLSWLTTTLLVTVRLAAATAMVPIFGTTRMPGAARIGVTFAISALLVAAMPAPLSAPTSSFALAVAMGVEACTGAAFAAGFAAAHGAAELAGRALDTQIGFGAAALLNPATQTYAPLLGNLLSLLSIATFLSLDGHLVLIKALSMSLLSTPPGVFFGDFEWGDVWRQAGFNFSVGLTLAAPVMFLFLLADIAMAVFARSMPQLNVLVLGFAVKILLGLAGLAYAVQFLQPALNQLFFSTFGYWEQLAS
jgi:flagellar biosynthetic protein FliR